MLRPRRLSYAVLLPIAELALWSAVVLIPALLIYGRFHAAQRSANARIASGQFESMLPRDHWLAFSVATVCDRRFHIITNLNLPGVLVGAPLSVAAVPYLRQHSSTFSVYTWHTMTMPFFCLPVWWFVGRGMDDLLTRRRPHWTILAIGSVLCCASIALLIGILISPPADKRDLMPFLPGAIFWTIVFGLFPSNWPTGRRHRMKVAG